MTKSVQHAGTRWHAVSMALALAIVLLPALAATPSAQAQTYTQLYSFTGGSDGGYPIYGSLIRDAAGNLYGVTEGGGNNYCGVLFEVPAGGGETVLHSFNCGSDGGYPYGTIVMGPEGTIYGTAYYYGTNYYGTVWSYGLYSGTFTTLYNFTGGADGGYPFGGVVLGAAHAVYGTTYYGGANDYGVVYQVNPKTKTETVLHTFDYSDGAYPYEGLVTNFSNGKIQQVFGTTYYGGSDSYGTVFRVDTKGNFKSLGSFDYTDGGYIFCAPYRGPAGNIFGTAEEGGSSGYGTIWELKPATGTVTALYNFDYTNGGYPLGGVVRDTSGNFYGVAEEGGSSGYGVVWALDTSNNETVVHSFDYSDGAYPLAGLIIDSSGTLYGTAEVGGTNGAGVVFSISSPKKASKGK